MIRYALTCDRGHPFDSWFQNAAAFDRLAGAGQVACPNCGSTATRKALMAPRVGGEGAEPRGTLTALSDGPEDAKHRALAELRAKVEANSDYVGRDFVTRARAMHDGAEPHRPIHGEAALPEAKRLIEDGVPIAPLPFLPKAKVN